MKSKKMPLRKCISCGDKKNKKDLIRVVKNKEEGVILDLTGKKNGRGAYICNDLECLNSIKKTKKLSKVLGCEIPEEIFEELTNIILKKNHNN